MIYYIVAYLVICSTYVLYIQKHDEKIEIEKEKDLCPYICTSGKKNRNHKYNVKDLPCTY